MKKLTLFTMLLVLLFLVSCQKAHYTITFQTNGGEPLKSQNVSIDGTFTLPTPIRIGYMFGGWYEDESLTMPFPLTSSVNENLTLYANWYYGKACGLIYDRINDYYMVKSFNLEQVHLVIPSSYEGYPVQGVSNLAFINVQTLQSVVFADGVQTIGKHSFQGTINLTTVTLSKTIETIDSTAFLDTPKLLAFEVDPLNPYFSSVEGVLYNKDQTVLVLYPSGKEASDNLPS